MAPDPIAPTPTMPNTYLFAYGTLLTGTGDPALDRAFRAAVCDLGPAWVAGRLVRLQGYPGAVEGAGQVWGRLFEVTRTRCLLRRLDRYEGVSDTPQTGAFLRRLTPVHTPARPRLADLRLAWVYWYRGATRGRALIHSGRWHARR